MCTACSRANLMGRIGTCRKKVMGLLRLMGNKADVVKGLAKRCRLPWSFQVHSSPTGNEQWLVAPKSDIVCYIPSRHIRRHQSIQDFCELT